MPGVRDGTVLQHLYCAFEHRGRRVNDANSTEYTNPACHLKRLFNDVVRITDDRKCVTYKRVLEKDTLQSYVYLTSLKYLK